MLCVKAEAEVAVLGHYQRSLPGDHFRWLRKIGVAFKSVLAQEPSTIGDGRIKSSKLTALLWPEFHLVPQINPFVFVRPTLWKHGFLDHIFPPRRILSA